MSDKTQKIVAITFVLLMIGSSALYGLSFL